MKSKANTTKADATLEHEQCEQSKEVECFDSSLDAVEVVTRLALSFVFFLGAVGWTVLPILGFRGHELTFSRKVYFH